MIILGICIFANTYPSRYYTVFPAKYYLQLSRQSPVWDKIYPHQTLDPKGFPEGRTVS